MTRSCTICTHDERAEIDSRLVRREPYRDIARQYSLSKDALSRHVKAHLLQELALAERKRQEDQADELLTDVRRLQVEAELILREAKADGMHRTALAALREARHTLALRYQVKDWAELARRLDELEEKAS